MPRWMSNSVQIYHTFCLASLPHESFALTFRCKLGFILKRSEILLFTLNCVSSRRETKRILVYFDSYLANVVLNILKIEFRFVNYSSDLRYHFAPILVNALGMPSTHYGHDFWSGFRVRRCQLYGIDQAQVSFEDENVVGHGVVLGHSVGAGQQNSAKGFQCQTQEYLHDQLYFGPPFHSAGSSLDGDLYRPVAEQKLAVLEDLGLANGSGHFTAEFQVNISGYRHLVEHIRHEDESGDEADLVDHFF